MCFFRLFSNIIQLLCAALYENNETDQQNFKSRREPAQTCVNTSFTQCWENKLQVGYTVYTIKSQFMEMHEAKTVMLCGHHRIDLTYIVQRQQSGYCARRDARIQVFGDRIVEGLTGSGDVPPESGGTEYLKNIVSEQGRYCGAVLIYALQNFLNRVLKINDANFNPIASILKAGG